eukprot:TRINITY_DN56095_c0_g1_i1.p1 TRINITY_DN56095_c0_g1~~TRINITY_DN56095_c0_g1_i1.p1  ORF type:complete len:197 (+),score=26.32 TRINITY_DN56095_c0_g1_i1:477-1067(+)
MTSQSFPGASVSGCGSAIVENVAKALEIAINDSSDRNMCFACAEKQRRRRGADAERIAMVFDSSVVPPISIEKYLLRLFTAFRCSEASFVVALMLVDRVLQHESGRIQLTRRNVHRVFLAGLVVAVKFYEDRIYTNRHYAKSGGVHLMEVNRLERVLLVGIDFDLYVQPEQYGLYECMLSKFSSGGSSSLPMQERE